jgi:acyl carrier protein
MSEQEVRQKLIEIIKEQAKLEEDEFINARSFEKIIDSLTLLEIVCEIEDDFDLEIDDEQISQLRSFDEVVTQVNQMVQGK